MPAGRPTDYTPELLEKALGYVDYVIGGTQDVEIIPSAEGLAIYLGIARSTLYKWSSEKPEFSDIVDNVLTVQARTLINKGLADDYNATITKLLLSKHGYHDKQETDVTSGGKPLSLTDEQYERIIRASAAKLGNQESGTTGAN